MCGIAGVVRFEGTVVREELERFCSVMKHRGPDQSGVYTDAQPGLALGLGTVRLAIQDLSPAGSQPMIGAGGETWIAYNGEVYNHPALKEELERRGARYRSRSDTETLLHAYDAWGPDFLGRLDGMYALALYDRRRRRVLLARDRTGVKPLYYYQTATALYFASELKVLLDHPAVPRRLDRRALQLYLTLGYVPSPFSLIEGVRKLGAGSSLLVEAGGRVREQPYWRIPHVDPAAARRSDADLERELRRLMEETVAAQLLSDVPVGASLSGGVDSTVVVALAQRQRDTPLDTFAVGFASGPGQPPINPLYNQDLEHAREVARVLGTRHHEVLIEGGPALLDEAPRLAGQMDEPVWEGSFLSIYKVSRLARDHGIIVLLTGDGGDELFGGYPHVAGALRHARIEAHPLLPALLPLAQPFLGGSPLGERVRQMRRRIALGPAELYRQRYELIPEEQRTLLLGERVSSLDLLNEALAPVLSGGPGRPYTEFLTRADFHLWLREHFNQRLDRMSMAASVEARVPFQGARLVDFALGLPLERKATATEPKRLLRRACADLIPENVLRRAKRPFAVPGADWLLGDTGRLLHEALSPERVRAVGALDPAGVQEVVGRAAEFGPRANHRVWALLWFQLWAEQTLAPRRAVAAV